VTLRFDTLCKLLGVVVVLLLVMPLVAIILFSFSGKIESIPTELTFRWFTMRMGVLWRSVQVSLLIAVPALAIALAISLPLGVAVTRREFPGRSLVDQIIILPLLLPGTVFGLALLQLFNSAGFERVPPLVVLVLAHVAIVIPTLARPLIAALQEMDQRMEEAAQTLGARPTRIFRDITLPMISNAVIVGLVLGFARSVNDFNMTFFLITPDYVPLSIYIYNSTNYSIPQLTSANAVVLLMMSLAVVFLSERLIDVRRKL
jgi:putative spermidine/putrescine transport system permease protein